MQEVWDQIEAIPGYARKKSSLLKVREFLGLLGEPDREFQVIHVAGTNGKGSVCAFLTSMIQGSKNSLRDIRVPSSCGYPGAVPYKRGDSPGAGFYQGISGGTACLQDMGKERRAPSHLF